MFRVPLVDSLNFEALTWMTGLVLNTVEYGGRPPYFISFVNTNRDVEGIWPIGLLQYRNCHDPAKLHRPT